ncbi:MAG: regulatory protein RecX [Calditrichota bacterium]
MMLDRSESEAGATNSFVTLALKIIARRDVSARELAKRLAKKGATPDIVQAVVEEMERLGYVNDRELALEHIRRGRDSRLVGRLLLTLELKQKGVAEDLIRDTLENLYPSEYEADVARLFIAKRYPRFDTSGDAKELRRVISALERRGLRGENITYHLLNNFNR